MKYHIKVFLLSLAMMALGFVLHIKLDLELSVPMVEQAKAISYIVTMVGIVSAFGWYKRNSFSESSKENHVQEDNVVVQRKLYRYLTIINLVNAFILVTTVDESILMMSAMSLMAILVSRFIFKAMYEK